MANTIHMSPAPIASDSVRGKPWTISSRTFVWFV